MNIGSRYLEMVRPGTDEDPVPIRPTPGDLRDQGYVHNVVHPSNVTQDRMGNVGNLRSCAFGLGGEVVEVNRLLQKVAVLDLRLFVEFPSGVKHHRGFALQALVQFTNHLARERTVLIGVVLIGYLADYKLRPQTIHHVRRRRDCRPNNGLLHATACHRQANLRGQKYAVQVANETTTVEGKDQGRENINSFRSLAEPAELAPQLAANLQEEICVEYRRKSHRNRVDK